MPTVRIDDEVYAWLQKNARPFEDTPNTVLRRIAGLNETNTHSDTKRSKKMMSISNRKLSGRYLNKEWNVGAKHALYHKDGSWFNNLERFPGALFDPNGYVLFKTEKEYRNCIYLNISQETNVPNTISKIPGYIKVV